MCTQLEVGAAALCPVTTRTAQDRAGHTQLVWTYPDPTTSRPVQPARPTRALAAPSRHTYPPTPAATPKHCARDSQYPPPPKIWALQECSVWVRRGLAWECALGMVGKQTLGRGCFCI